MPYHPFASPLVDYLRRKLKENGMTSLGQITGNILADWAGEFYDWYQAQAKAAKKRKPKVQADPTEAERIYEAYPRHVGKDEALKAISKALVNVPYPDLLSKVQMYGQFVSKWGAADRDYIPYPASWFNAGRYKDDPKEWSRNGQNGYSGAAGSDPKPSPDGPAPTGWEGAVRRHYGRYASPGTIENIIALGWEGNSRETRKDIIRAL